MFLPRAPLLCLALLVGSWGCAAGRSAMGVSAADEALRTAEASGADQFAEYQWTLADAYLRKAREEWSASQYEVALELAEEALRWSEEADNVARERAAIPMMEKAAEEVEEPLLVEPEQDDDFADELLLTPDEPSDAPQEEPRTGYEDEGLLHEVEELDESLFDFEEDLD